MVTNKFQIIKEHIPENVTLVVAVKYASLEQITKLVENGIKNLGFNTYQHLREIKEYIPKEVKIHFIGHLQKNKVRKLLELKVDLIQSVDSYELAEKVDHVSGELGIKQNILLQVKTDENKEFGILPQKVKDIAIKISSNLKNIQLLGLMTIPPNSEEVRPYFKLMKKLYDQFSGLKYLSMGMSKDYKVAIEEGANMVRIGRAIFT